VASLTPIAGLWRFLEMALSTSDFNFGKKSTKRTNHTNSKLRRKEGGKEGREGGREKPELATKDRV